MGSMDHGPIDKERVKLARRRLHVTQEGLASILGVARDTVASWETGRTPCKGPAAILLQVIIAMLESQREATLLGQLGIRTFTEVHNPKEK